jgi:type 1 glutamine amidotransferase
MRRLFVFFWLMAGWLPVFGQGFISAQDVRPASYAGNTPRFHALLYYSDQVEEAHREFSHQAIAFFNKLTVGEGFIVDLTQNLGAFTADQLKEYSAIIALNAAPSREARPLFENYMENGGGWIGFHAAAYNDSRTQWPWFLKFLGGGVFKCNNWPPQPALLELDRKDHPVTRNLPDTYVCPATEFYQWTPEPRENPDIEVLVSLSPRNFPMGLKDIVYGGDFPVVWTNRNYRMIYINMGHGDEQFSDATEQLLFINALQWIVTNDPNGNPLDK